MKGDSSHPLCLGHDLCQKKKMVLPGKIPVCQGIGFLAKNLGGSCQIHKVCPTEGVWGIQLTILSAAAPQRV